MRNSTFFRQISSVENDYLFKKKLFLGLIVSVGGVTERLVRQSSLSLFEELQRMKSAELTEFGQIFLNLFRQYQKID